MDIFSQLGINATFKLFFGTFFFADEKNRRFFFNLFPYFFSNLHSSRQKNPALFGKFVVLFFCSADYGSCIFPADCSNFSRYMSTKKQKQQICRKEPIFSVGSSINYWKKKEIFFKKKRRFFSSAKHFCSKK